MDLVMNGQPALLLSHLDLSVEGKKRIGKLLSFFGAPWRTLSLAELLPPDRAGNTSSSQCRLICSSDTLLRLIEDLERNPERIWFWKERVHSAFVYAGDDSEVLQKLARILSGDEDRK